MAGFEVAEYRKADGRLLRLYARRPMRPVDTPVPSPTGLVAVNSHMRWHPVLEEWVIYAAHRQERTFAPTGGGDPLAPTTDPAHPTELPSGDWEVAAFENRFPSLVDPPPSPPQIAAAGVAAARGRCEVVVFSQDIQKTLGRLCVDHVVLILEVIAERTAAMAAAGLQYVLPFENRGAEMGVTLHHPHAQIYGYGVLPARQAASAAALRRHREASGSDLVSALAREECAQETRLVARAGEAVAFVPPFARFPYETWVAPLRHVPDLAGLKDAGRADVAQALKEALCRLDTLFDRPMPYLLTIDQAPCDGEPHPEWTVHVQIRPLRRARDKLKYLAGTELGADVFTSDVLPEDAAAALRASAPI